MTEQKVVIRYKKEEAGHVWYAKSFYSGPKFRIAYLTIKKEKAAQYSPAMAEQIIRRTVGGRNLTTEPV